MAITIDNLLLPCHRILIKPDSDSNCTGVVFRRSPKGGGQFTSMPVTDPPTSPAQYERVLFAKEMATEVEIDGEEYYAMHSMAVVGLIPD